MRKIGFPALLATFAAFASAFSPFPRDALARSCEQPLAIVVSVQGDVRAKHAPEADWVPARLNDAFCGGARIRVTERSRADLYLANETTLRLDQNTEIAFSAKEKERESWLSLFMGGAFFQSRTPKRFSVTTPIVNAGIEGTEFLFRVDQDKAFLTVFEGNVRASNDLGSVLLGSGQSMEARAGQPPSIVTVVRPRDAVQWTLHYPPIRVEAVAGIPRDWKDQAARLLEVGRADEAMAVIDNALETAPGGSDALALRAVVAVAHGEGAAAIRLAQRAVAADRESAAARIALSYAQQAAFDLEGALATLEEAVKAEPGNALARARYSELLLSFGRLDEALDEAKKASAQPPEVARTQTVLGFAYLAQMRLRDSRAAFERAIGLDPADPLPRLGLGLTAIRGGDVRTGRREIEIAASLDPNSSLIRSYLGKAYYEEKRGKTASTQFLLAKELDPNDPTPHYYDAILKQSLNRPVEALHDLQKSISLNDNRAVYRSRLLLDDDLAARSASLGRIYDDLGFQQLALVEGWKSVNTDPANHSAHRFLADSYSALPRHEIARVSELLQSQLLQPININPVQPSLAQKNLFILEGAGPSSPSFNEFNPLFYRNRLALQAMGVVGENGIRGEEIAHSGVVGKFSYSVGQFHFESDGFRENNDQEQNIYNAFVQTALSHRTSILAEFRAFDIDKGDLELRFLPGDFFRNLRLTERNRSGRVGFRHALSPGSDLVGTMAYERGETRSVTTDRIPFPDPPPGFVLESSIGIPVEDRVFTVELQQLLRRRNQRIVAGAGYVHINRDEALDVSFIPNPPQDPEIFPPVVTHESLDTDIDHTNAYLYLHVRYPESANWTVGGSVDFLEDSRDAFRDRDQFNPKAGVVWTPRAGTTVRAAVFRVLRRTLPVTSQTIEPTQVAGFNQFFDDPGGTESWRYGAAVDQDIADGLFAGVEYSRRELEVPVNASVPPAPTILIRLDWRELLWRAYANWTPHAWLALSADYIYERQERERDTVKEVRTHRIPLAARFFHPSGCFASFIGTFFDQEGVFFRIGQSPSVDIPEAGNDRFWIFDASVGYRLPERWGIVSIDAKNLFDRSFRYQDTDPVSPSIQPVRSVVARITLAF